MTIFSVCVRVRVCVCVFVGVGECLCVWRRGECVCMCMRVGLCDVCVYVSFWGFLKALCQWVSEAGSSSTRDFLFQRHGREVFSSWYVHTYWVCWLCGGEPSWVTHLPPPPSPDLCFHQAGLAFQTPLTQINDRPNIERPERDIQVVSF